MSGRSAAAALMRPSADLPWRSTVTPARLRRALQSLAPQITPAAALRALIADGLDALPWPASGDTLLRWQCLAEVAGFDLSLAKLYEGHTDALAILHELHCSQQHLPGSAWGVWAAEAAQARLLVERLADGTLRLHRRKAWCSGAEALTHALATAWFADGHGPQLVAIDVRQHRLTPGGTTVTATAPSAGATPIRIEHANWHAVGMADSSSLDLQFEGTPVHAVGTAAEYLTRPGFWHGGAGIAACWYGGARALADELRAAVAAAGPSRPEQALRCVALGKVDLALRRCAAVLRDTARWIDDHPRADARLPALRARLAAERCAPEVLEQVGGALGAGPLCRDRRLARLFADLPVFVRQCHGERDFMTLGTAIAESAGETPIDSTAADAPRQPQRQTASSTARTTASESAWQL